MPSTRESPATTGGDRAITSCEDIEMNVRDGEDTNSRNSNIYTKNVCELLLKKKLFRVSLAASFGILVIVLTVMVVLFVISGDCEEKQCVKLDDIPNGRIINSTGSNHGDSIHIECITGSELFGSSVVTCLSSDKWSDNPRCILRHCKTFVMPEHASEKLNITSTVVGSELQIDCQNGFLVQGNKSVVCKSNDEWSESPVCEPINCGEPINVTNVLYKNMSGTKYNDTIDVECAGGYTLIGEVTITCQADAKWSSMPVCQPVSCGIPNIPENGQIKTVRGTTFGETAILKCDDGYFMTGDSNITCQSDAKWSDMPVCQPVSCGIPNIPENGHIKTMLGTTFGETALLECDEGYIITGDSNVTCMADGSWMTGPTCSLLSDCYDIRTVNNTLPSGIYIVTLWKSRQNIKVYCDMETDGGGWTVFQNRFNGSVDFYRTFNEYVNGFGNINEEFWLGLNFIDEMVSKNQTELRIDVQAADGDTAYENHQNFYLIKESNFLLRVDRGTGTAGDNGDGLSFNNGKQFSTHDKGPDTFFASSYQGAWWYFSGSYLNLNGEYRTPGSVNKYDARGMYYRPYKGFESLQACKMMFRRTRG